MKTFFAVCLLAIFSVGCASNRTSTTDNLNGLGPVHHAVSTNSAEAQRAFDAGLAYCYGFNHEAAIKSFKHAAELDPDLAMAYWGEALALGPNYNVNDVDPAAEKAAFDALHQAIRHSGKATQGERDFIDALSARYSSDPKPDYHKLQVDYADAMGKLSKKYPNDLDAATLYAESLMNLHPWKLWHADGTPEEGTLTIVATLERVMARDPNHIGANHFYIHAVEASKNPERALASAKRLPALAPKQGHLVHMPAHVYIRTGNYAAAIKANQDAIQADEKFVACCNPGMNVYTTMYYNHNIHFLMMSACMTNQSKLAIESADRVAADIKPIAPKMMMVEPFMAMPSLARVRFAKWDEILAMQQPDASLPTAAAADHFARAMAHAGKGDLVGARSEADAFESARTKFRDEIMGNNTVTQVLEMASHLLAGKIAAASGDSSRAIDEYRRAVEMQDKLTYDEPPPWPWSMREPLGAALLANHDAASAEKVFRDDLLRHPNNPRAFLGLADALSAQGKPNDREMKAFRDGTRDADVQITVANY